MIDARKLSLANRRRSDTWIRAGAFWPYRSPVGTLDLLSCGVPYRLFSPESAMMTLEKSPTQALGSKML
jgi:hypothetical protein